MLFKSYKIKQIKSFDFTTNYNHKNNPICVVFTTGGCEVAFNTYYLHKSKIKDVLNKIKCVRYKTF